MSAAQSRYALLTELSAQTSSDQRRDLLRKVTAALGHGAHSESEFAELDGVLSVVAQEYSVGVRTEFARLVAASTSRFPLASEKLAFDDIVVAAPILRDSRVLSEATLLKVVEGKSQPHLMAVTQRASVSQRVSHALAEHGSDAVVTSLLANQNADIAHATYETVARRAEASPALQAPLVRRANVPVDILHDLYARVEADLRREIVTKFGETPPGELEKAFERSRARTDKAYRRRPEDFTAAQGRVAQYGARGQLQPALLATLLREGMASRTSFMLAFARLADIEYDVVEPAVQDGDIDTLALLCRGAGFDKALFVAIAVGLDTSERGMAKAESFGKLYESVPVQAAQRALRFWKVRATG